MGKKRILIVEDDETLNDIYRISFGKVAEFEVDLTKSVKEANIAIKQHQPDAIILDLLLPGDVGLSLLKQLQEEGLVNKIPVLVATNMNDFNLINRALKLGARDYFVKSESQVEDLINECKNLLDIAD